VWSPRLCLTRADGDSDLRWHVMGLIAGWGTVALHGTEGFRAQRVAIQCLFTDWPASPPTSRVGAGRLINWWRRRTGRLADLDPPAGPMKDPRRRGALQAVAARYAVPLISLQAAADVGLLGEFGVPPPQIEEARLLGSVCSPAQTDRPHSR
jgi:hypothetical protein